MAPFLNRFFSPKTTLADTLATDVKNTLARFGITGDPALYVPNLEATVGKFLNTRNRWSSAEFRLQLSPQGPYKLRHEPIFFHWGVAGSIPFLQTHQAPVSPGKAMCCVVRLASGPICDKGFGPYDVKMALIDFPACVELLLDPTKSVQNTIEVLRELENKSFPLEGFECLSLAFNTLMLKEGTRFPNIPEDAKLYTRGDRSATMLHISRNGHLVLLSDSLSDNPQSKFFLLSPAGVLRSGISKKLISNSDFSQDRLSRVLSLFGIKNLSANTWTPENTAEITRYTLADIGKSISR